jgi:hypothetical protein
VLPIILHQSIIWPLALQFQFSIKAPGAYLQPPEVRSVQGIGAKYHTFWSMMTITSNSDLLLGGGPPHSGEGFSSGLQVVFLIIAITHPASEFR